MFTDTASLGLALLAHWVARRPPSSRATYGYARAEVLAAFVNALALLALVVFIVIEAVRRLLVPQPVAGGMVLGIASVGLLVNLVAAWMLFRAGNSLNTRVRAAARAVRHAGFRGCDRRRRRDRRHGMDTDRSDPVVVRVVADRAVDMAACSRNRPAY